MNNITFHLNGWDDYLYWQEQDKKTLRKLNKLIKDIERSPYEGIGKPEPLQYEWQGYWSRRIDEKNRLVYRVLNNQIEIAQCRSHYGE